MLFCHSKCVHVLYGSENRILSIRFLQNYLLENWMKTVFPKNLLLCYICLIQLTSTVFSILENEIDYLDLTENSIRILTMPRIRLLLMVNFDTWNQLVYSYKLLDYSLV